jgi:hypothetical protein
MVKMLKNKFSCEPHDDYLYQVMVTLESFFTTKNIKVKYEETKTSSNQFFYYIKNLKNNLEGYVGRDINTKKVIYLIKDKSRLEWAKKEGFFDSGNLDSVIYDQIKIIRRLNGIQSFINFITGEKEYYFNDDIAKEIEEVKAAKAVKTKKSKNLKQNT